MRLLLSVTSATGSLSQLMQDIEVTEYTSSANPGLAAPHESNVWYTPILEVFSELQQSFSAIEGELLPGLSLTNSTLHVGDADISVESSTDKGFRVKLLRVRSGNQETAPGSDGFVTIESNRLHLFVEKVCMNNASLLSCRLTWDQHSLYLLALFRS